MSSTPATEPSPAAAAPSTTPPPPSARSRSGKRGSGAAQKKRGHEAQQATGNRNLIPNSTAENPSPNPNSTSPRPQFQPKNPKRRQQQGNRQGKPKQNLNPTAAAWEPPKQKSEDEACILCASPLDFVAIGHCNHPVCSVCSLRLRLRLQDTSCAVCKASVGTVVVCPARALRPFATFGLDDDSPAVGTDVELRSRSFFVGCKDHFKEATKLLSLKCPSCHSNFQSEKALFKHVKTVHSLQFCELCFTHRPLFACEQKLMTSAELSEHTNSPPGSMIGSGGDKSGGHPLCKFCSKRFFDSQALYAHMRDAHFTCHLCPSRYQQRFYRGVVQLFTHLQSSHFVCHTCLPSAEIATLQNYGEILHSSFARKEEYLDHLRRSHGVSSSVASGNSNALSMALASSFPVSGSRTAAPEDPTVEYLDLNMASADPYRLASDTSASHTTFSTQHLQGDRLVPPHMRVLGRVTGGGTFLNEAQLQAEEERLEEVRNGGRGQRGRKEKSEQSKGPSRPQVATAPGHGDFPALSSTGNNPQEAASAPHPLSVVPSLKEKEKLEKAKATEKEQLRLQEREIAVRKVQRNMALADALGLDTMALSDAVKMAPSAGPPSHKSGSDYELDSGLMRHLLANSFLSSLEMCVEYASPTACVKSSARVDLRRPLYHPDMLVWAKNYRADLLRTEKKIFELLSDRSASSVQLKPMKKWSRETVLLLAKSYLLSAQEYSTLAKDGDMYVSLVKTVDSCLPATALSTAADPPTGTGLSSTDLQAMLVEEIRLCVEREDFRPQILFTIRRAGAGATIGEFLCELKATIDSDFRVLNFAHHRLTELSCLGYSHLRLTFSSLGAALLCHRLCKTSTVLPVKYHIDPYFPEDLSLPPLELRFPDEEHQPVVSKESSADREEDWRASAVSRASIPPSAAPTAAPAPPDKWDLAFQEARSRVRPTLVSPPQPPPTAVNSTAVKKSKKPTRAVAKKDKPLNSFSLLDSDSDSDLGS